MSCLLFSAYSSFTSIYSPHRSFILNKTMPICVGTRYRVIGKVNLSFGCRTMMLIVLSNNEAKRS